MYLGLHFLLGAPGANLKSLSLAAWAAPHQCIASTACTHASQQPPFLLKGPGYVVSILSNCTYKPDMGSLLSMVILIMTGR